MIYASLPSFNKLNEQYLGRIPDLTDLQVTVLDDFKVFYNLTNVTITKFGMNSNRFKLRFNELRNYMEISQDSIKCEVQFDYRLYTVPPLVADKGTLRLAIEELSIQAAVNVLSSPEGKPMIKILSLKPEFSMDKLVMEVLDCYSDLTRSIFEEIQFYKEFHYQRLSNMYGNAITEGLSVMVSKVLSIIPTVSNFTINNVPILTS